MDGSREAREGPRRTVRVLRKLYDKDAQRSGERPVVCPSSPSQTQQQQVSSPMAADGAGYVSATPGIVASPPASQQHKDFRLGKSELSVLLEGGPATDTGVHYHMSDLVTMRTQTEANTVGVARCCCYFAVWHGQAPVVILLHF